MTPLEIAIGQIGVREATGQNDGVPSERFMGGRREPWCAHFVAWCFREAGRPLPGDRPGRAGAGGENPLASVAEMERRLRKNGRVREKSDAFVPKAGDIIFFADRGGSDRASAGGRHVGIVELVHDGDAGVLIGTVEGNLANQVARRVHRYDDPRIVGFGVQS